ncbi:MAG: FAD-dependent oxidoreductase [Desulfobacterales bacterium]|nr:FAD-dependent oxidoreductase [Desulfobacterales bacterium]
MYKYLFSPIRINQLEVKNRIAYPALGVLYSHDMKLNERYYEYYREKAKGGAGIVTVGPVGIDHLGSGFLALSLSTDEPIEDFRKLTGIIRDEGASPWIQLFHAGAYSHPILINNETPMAPSAIFSKYSKTTPREMTAEDIAQVQEAFVATALRAKEAGFDGVEIIGSGGYLITQFLSPLKNRRTDGYGGSFENRVRFPKEVIERCRAALGKDYPLTIRMAGNDFVPGSNTDAETPAIARVYEKAGVDALNVTGGWHETRVPQLPMELPRSAYAYLALNVKKAVTVPVMASNRIADPDSAEKIIRDGYADMVNLGRVLIADPFWPQKAFEGRAAEIRPCTACGQGCSDMVFSGQAVFCAGNPRAGFEKERQVKKTEAPKSVMVIGAGAAGLEAAVTATQMGHRVAIYDRASDIGGQLWLAGAPPHKQELLELIRYYRAMINRYDIALHLDTNVDAAFIQAQSPDHVIVATGAAALVPPIPGADGTSVLTGWDVLRDNPPLGKEVAIIGGGAVGLETALFVAAKGTINAETLHFLFSYEAATPERLRQLLFKGTSHVTVFEMLPKAGTDVGRSTRWVLFDSLNRYNVGIETGATVKSLDRNSVTWEKEGKETSQHFDNVIVASGSRSVNSLGAALETLNMPFATVGDCIRPGKINDAIHGGFLAALDIDRR